MKNPLNTTAALDAGLLLARAPLGIYLAWVGYRQWADDGPGAFAAHHQAALSRVLPPALAGGFLYLTPVAEAVAGTLLILGLFSRVGGFLAAPDAGRARRRRVRLQADRRAAVRPRCGSTAGSPCSCASPAPAGSASTASCSVPPARPAGDRPPR